jgi:hypothetical protein
MYAPWIPSPPVAQPPRLPKEVLFTRQFNIPFSRLQSMFELTGMTMNDGCEHFIDRLTKERYSWNFLNHSWMPKKYISESSTTL